MTDKHADFIDVANLRVGHYVFLDVGWMGHPFALNSFRVATQSQIDTIRSLGIERIRYSVAQSVFPEDEAAAEKHVEGSNTSADVLDEAADEVQQRQQRRQQLATQRASLQRCEGQFSDAARGYKQILDTMYSQPELARARSTEIIDEMIRQMGSADEETYVRLLSEKAGEKTSLHSINVAIISLLLGKAMDCDAAQMHDIGVGALLHDIGKIDLPDRLRWADRELSSAEMAAYREHVTKGATLAKKVGLATGAQRIVAHHHERHNGSGYPAHLQGDSIDLPSRIVSLVNEYDNLCNPGNPALSVTPHEALSLIYAQQKALFDTRTLAVFVRLMGVYPPGSVVELSTGQFAMVVSVNSARPLRPHVVVHDTAVPASEALIFDLEQHPDVGIRRSLKPQHLPRAAFDYLSPRKRLCYFFERSREFESLEIRP
jgi:putative nucleotidyltransferase with HDIG domain